MTIAKQKEMLHQKIDRINDVKILNKLSDTIEDSVLILPTHLEDELLEIIDSSTSENTFSSDQMSKIAEV
jgi:hypothetical protein